MVFKTVMFDLDGTLLNTLGDLHDSVNHMLTEKGYPLKTIEQVRALLGDGVASLVQEVLPGGISAEETLSCLASFSTYYEAHKNCRTQPYPGILPLLQHLRAGAYQVAVVSNKYDRAVKALCQAHFGELIPIAVGERPGFAKKPAPDNVLWVIEQLGALPEQTLYVGDSEVDVRTAKNAGLISAAVTWGFRDRSVLIREGADYLLDRPEDLLKLI